MISLRSSKQIYNLIKQPHRNDVRNFIEGLYLWYSTKSIYNSGNISTFNRKHKLWGLENNIILDASASLDGVYKLSDSFNVLSQGRIIDHSKSRFTTVDFNSSKSNLKNDEQLIYPEIANRIRDTQKCGDKVLIVCHKSNADKIRLQLIKAGLTSVYIYGLPKGSYSKKKIKSDLNIDDGHLNRVLTNDKIRNLVGRIIKVGYRDVEKL
jgi:hypothetical protein